MKNSGRPPLPIDTARLRELAALGLSVQQIADRLGISRRTLFNRMEADPEIRAAVDQGLSEATETAARNLQQLGRDGNLGALIFFLKTKGGFTVPKAEPPPPAVTINIGSQPAPVTLEHARGMAERQGALLRQLQAGDGIEDEDGTATG